MSVVEVTRDEVRLMKAVAVPPKFPPASKQPAHATGTARSIPKSANIRQKIAMLSSFNVYIC